MKRKKIYLMAAIATIGFITSSLPLRAGDLDDNIAQVSDEPMAADENMGGKDTNITFIVSDAIAKAKMKQGEAKKNDQTTGQKSDPDSDINFNDGEGEKNQNSIVLGAGSRVDKVINVVVQK